jgi:hypothetical protein
MNNKQTIFFVLCIFAFKPQNLFGYAAERTLISFPKFVHDKEHWLADTNPRFVIPPSGGFASRLITGNRQIGQRKPAKPAARGPGRFPAIDERSVTSKKALHR